MEFIQAMKGGHIIGETLMPWPGGSQAFTESTVTGIENRTIDNSAAYIGVGWRKGALTIFELISRKA
jgi:hypothetical protein